MLRHFLFVAALSLNVVLDTIAFSATSVNLRHGYRYKNQNNQLLRDSRRLQNINFQSGRENHAAKLSMKQLPSESTRTTSGIYDGLLHFRELQDMASRIEVVREKQVKFMGGFYNDKLKCYQHSATANQRVSISSHWRREPLFAPLLLLTMMRLGEPSDSEIMISTLAQTVLLLGTSVGIDAVKLPQSVALFRTSSEERDESAGAPALGIGHGSKNSLSMYLLHWNTRALVQALQAVDPSGVPYVCPEQLEELSAVLDQVSRYTVDELCRQLAFHYAGDKAKFDVIQLAYALLNHFQTCGAAAGLERTAAGGQVKMPPLNMKVVERALAVIFGEQMDNGLWPQGAPIDPVGDKLRGDVGNSFVFSLDLLASLLDLARTGHAELLRPYVPHVDRSLKWVEDNIVESVIARPGDAAESGGGGYLRGWRSNHLRGDGGPIMWCTAQVFMALAGMRTLMSELKNKDVLEEFGGRRADGDPDVAPWNQLLDADLVLGGDATTLKTAIDRHLIEPLVRNQAHNPLQGSQPSVEPSKVGHAAGMAAMLSPPRYSMILYGPPGTAKTTICSSIARRLGWSFVTIDTSDFLADGLGHVASRMAYVFDRLMALERCVILFDEVEEFCLDREDRSLSMESRMLTTAMLTQLNELRRRQRCVFIVATNRIRSFDAAVTRPGRFDLILQVGTPGLVDRCRRLEMKLDAAGLSRAIQPAFDPNLQALVDVPAAELARNLLNERWENEVRFLSFAENESLLEELVGLVRGRTLSRETFAVVLNRIMRTATIQGAVREEFLSSMRLSRVS